MLIVEAAIAKYGEEHQLRQTQEEIAELIVAINKYERAIKSGKDTFPFKERTDIIEELIDVLIMVDSVKEILSISDHEMQLMRDYKTNRLFNRLKEESDL